jgi:GNAT superfamily N-acetyltransferase
MKFAIRAATTDEEILATFEVMRQLRPNVRRSSYLSSVKKQQQEVNFQLASLRGDNRVICVAGYRLCRSLGWGRYLYVDDLITDKHHRSLGVGKRMFRWLVKYAERDHCDEIRLDSALFRHEAHRFYLRERMDIACFHFRLKLDGGDQ